MIIRYRRDLASSPDRDAFDRERAQVLEEVNGELLVTYEGLPVGDEGAVVDVMPPPGVRRPAGRSVR